MYAFNHVATQTLSPIQEVIVYANKDSFQLFQLEHVRPTKTIAQQVRNVYIDILYLSLIHKLQDTLMPSMKTQLLQQVKKLLHVTIRVKLRNY